MIEVDQQSLRDHLSESSKRHRQRRSLGTEGNGGPAIHPPGDALQPVCARPTS